MWYEWSLINTLQSDTFSRMLSQCWTHTKAAVKAPSQSVLIDNTCGCFVLILIRTSKGSLTVWLTYSKLYSSFGYRNILQMDACTKGLGAVLLQDRCPMYFASKSLTTAQQNYVAIELEALAVSWAVQKFHHYLYGRPFMLQTDQKPLQAILSKSLVEATPHMQCLLLSTIPYDMTVEYIKGETNFIADCFSRALVLEDTIELPILQVNQITAHARCTQDKIN